MPNKSAASRTRAVLPATVVSRDLIDAIDEIAAHDPTCLAGSRAEIVRDLLVRGLGSHAMGLEGLEVLERGKRVVTDAARSRAKAAEQDRDERARKARMNAAKRANDAARSSAPVAREKRAS